MKIFFSSPASRGNWCPQEDCCYIFLPTVIIYLQLLQEASDAHKKISVLEEQEKQLRAQVALYAEKYEEFQQTLAKSNEVFQSFKTEMDKVSHDSDNH